MNKPTKSPARRAHEDARRYPRWVAREIGPRRIGGIYRTSYGDVYEVLSIEPGPRPSWPTWQIAVRTLGTDVIRRHSTAWGDRDQVVSQPENDELAALWAAWAIAHDPDPGRRDWENPENCEWRHLLDELAHSYAAQSFRALAPGYADAVAQAASITDSHQI